MSKHIISSDVEKARIAKWVMEAQPVSKNPTWVERRLAIVFGAHTYLIQKDQVFQCPHCGHYDPQWTATSVLSYFEENFGIKPIEIDVTCSVAGVES